MSLRVNPGPERVNNGHDRGGPIQEAEPSQEHNSARLDDLSCMAAKVSYAEQPRGNGVHARGACGHSAAELVLPRQQSNETPPLLRPPFHSQTASWQSSTILLEETPATEVRSTHEVGLYPPTPIAKRAMSPSPSPMRSKRPRLVSHEPGATPKRGFDPELLEVGIEVDLSDFDDDPPPYPWENGMSRLNFRPPTHPFLVTNSKLAEIWRSVCKHQGWCQSNATGELVGNDLSEVSQ